MADWLGHLVETRRQQGFVEPPPRQLAEQRARQQAEADEAIVALLVGRLDAAVIDHEAIRGHLDRFGPFDLDRAREVLDRLLGTELTSDSHITVVLDAIRDDAKQGGES